MNCLQIRLFGAPSVLLIGEREADLRSDKARGLLAYLAVESGQAHRREKLAGLLWPDYPDVSARTNLRRALADLRLAIGDQQASPPFLLIGQETIQFNTQSDASVDVLAFTSLLKEGRRAGTNEKRDPQSMAGALEEAIGLYRAPFLEGFSIPDGPAFEEWALLTREQLNRLMLQTLHRLAAAHQERGQYDIALQHAWRQVEMEPWQEGAHRQVMELLALSGQRAAAVAQYEACRRLLKTELGAEPSPQTRQLYEELRSGEWAPDTTGMVATRMMAARAVGACPYRGLAAFREEDAAVFFGREGLAARLAMLLEPPLAAAAIVGASGSGKSSMVFAGLLPRLRTQGSWLIAHCRPGNQPFQALAAALVPILEPALSETDRLVEASKLAKALSERDLALADVAARLLEKRAGARRALLVVDQFEELYTVGVDPAVRQQFLDALAEAARPARSAGSAPYGRIYVSAPDRGATSLSLLLTLRADFMAQALACRPIADLFQEAVLLLGPMTRQELRDVIERPAEKQGATFEPGLVERILEDVGEEPGSLPLLEFCLTLLWERQANGWLTHAAYEQTGQVDGALARYAEDVFGQLDEPDRDRARQIFVQLVRPGEGTEDTRRVATRVEIGEANWPLTQRLADSRLVVTSREAGSGYEMVEVAHEALIQRWERLRTWLATDRAFRSWQEGLRAALHQWEAAGQDEELLLRGSALSQAEAWLVERAGELGPEERAYIKAAVDRRERARAEQEARQERERRIERRSRRLLGALAAVLALAAIVATGLTVYSFSQRREALEAYSLSATANARGALADGDTSAALSLALAATNIDRPPLAARQTLLDAAYAPGARSRADVATLFPGMEGPATALTISPDGQIILVGTANGSIAVAQLKPERFAGPADYTVLAGHTSRVNDIAVSTDGTRALSGGDDHQAILWDLQTGAEIRRFSGHSGIVRAVDLSPDGCTLVSGGFSGDSMMAAGELILWDAATGQEIRRLAGHRFGIVAARFTPDGRGLLASSGDAAIFADSLPGSDASTEGPGLVVAELLLWDTASGQVRQRFQGLEEDAYDIAISPDGAQALAGSIYNNVSVIWDLQAGQKLRTLEGHREGVSAVAWSRDGRRALSGSLDDSLMLWDLAGGKAIAVLHAHTGDVLDVALTPDGRTAVSSDAGGGLIQWDLVDAAEVGRLSGHEDALWDVTFTPDGQQALSSSGAVSPNVAVQDASIRLWDLETGAQTQFAALPVDAIMQVAVSPDGETALVGTNEPFIRIWDLPHERAVRPWQETGRLEGHAGPVTGLEFTPDGTRALSVSVDGTLILWDVSARRIIHRFDGHGEGLWSLAISPDGRTALSDSGDSSMILWDLAAGTELRSFVRSDAPADPGSSGMAFLPHGSTAISCEQDGLLIEWNLETGREVRRLGEHASLRTRIAITPDGRLALTSGMDGGLMLWDLATGDLIRRSEGHGIVFDLALSPDGRTALVGSSDGTIVHWQLSNPSLEELRAWIKANRWLP